MNYNDNFVLVAPRPVRLTAPSQPAPFSPFHNRPQTRVANVRLVGDAVDRLKLGDSSSQDDVALKPSESATTMAERDPAVPASPRASPRANLSSEALEEFLSILQSSTLRFPPTSPILRASNGSAFFYRRSPHPSDVPDAADDIDGMTPAYPFKLLGNGSLASPVSRMHTRNPFQRHPSYEAALSGVFRPLSVSPAPTPAPTSPSAAVALSPATVPLPLPTPDESEMDVSA
ncbi:hypothetical protein WOLCODRAFT_136138 [Wolfiporia cocos MD-104 SS10]|uniref:Uncharacterized protein n=1 Tax=Wolfiporia cocos (strain MD-104) TaxID=742152 RepID=A0A2H3J7L7_WOLCO|nr:hypothetical protein WOLCODRAFT_136138 [Wolfiporia cocos MD-104 SS10]